MVVAYNNGESEYIDIAIHVTEYNKYAPVFRSSNYKIEVELIAPVGTEIIRVQAVDNDPQPYNSEIYYYVQSRVVSVNRTSGLISLRENLHPKDRVFTIGLLAFDGGSPRRMARSILTINVKILSAPRELSVEQTGDQWAMLCWSPPLSGSPSGYMIYLTSTTDFMSDRAPSVTTQRNVSREELGTRAGRNCTALTDLESWSDFEARIAGWDRSEIGMISKAVTFDTKVNPRVKRTIRVYSVPAREKRTITSLLCLSTSTTYYNESPPDWHHDSVDCLTSFYKTSTAFLVPRQASSVITPAALPSRPSCTH
ncbi:hypothetical protein J6590_041123 [Homalodisca vitripennis]|nr:hypothetical protein J6590_041123 [Homalodisca vitripennis]